MVTPGLLRKTKVGLLILSLLFIGPPMVAVTACEDTTGTCCRVCTTGKACGDSCIAQNLNCNVGPGCACNG